jgi:hypothetical protein
MSLMVKRPGSLTMNYYTRADLLAQVRAGAIKRDWLVRDEAEGKWERLDERFEFDWPEAADPSSVESDDSELIPPARETVVAQPPIARQTNPAQIPASAELSSRWTTKATKRYSDAYRVAAFYVGFGNTMKGIGVAIGILFALIGLIASQAGNGFIGVVAVIAGLFLGVMAGSIFYIAGILISADGQTLRAELDVAVYACPFLSDEERAKVMSL